MATVKLGWKIIIISIDLNMGWLKLVWARKFGKVKALKASYDFVLIIYFKNIFHQWTFAIKRLSEIEESRSRKNDSPTWRV